MPETLIGIQQQYIDTVNAGIARWAHARKHYNGDLGGHANRIAGGAHRTAKKKLLRIGFTEDQVRAALKDAWDMASLLRHAERNDE